MENKKKNGSLLMKTASVQIILAAALVVFFLNPAPAVLQTNVAQTSPQNSADLFGSSYSANRTVPKKIFAKALAKFLNIAPAAQTNCYSDLKTTDSASGYICALKRARIFTGSRTSKFHPADKTTWNFAVKSACRANNWTRSKTFAACRRYALSNNILERTVEPSTKPKYADLLQFFIRQTENDAPTTQNNSTSNIPNRQPSAIINSNPYPEGNILADFFANVSLANPIPNRFYLDEVYFIEGNLTNGTASEVFVFLCRDNQGCEDSTDYIASTTNNGVHFNIPVIFREVGNFQIGIIPGRSGESRITDISVMPEPPASITASSAAEAPTGLSANYSDGQTTFSWNTASSFKHLIIFQRNRRKDYLFRQITINAFAPPSEDFGSFLREQAFWLVQTGNLSSQIQQISLAVKEKFDRGRIEVRSLRETFNGPGHFTFSGRSLTPVSKKAYFTLPNGAVQEIDFAQEDLPAGRDFQIQFNLTSSGTYIFEINNTEGSAVLNVPVYVGNVTPLLPDFFALHPPELDTSPIENINQLQQSLLSFVNADRRSMNLPEVSLNTQLNGIAQAHSQNMFNLHFFGHVNPAGENPNDRRRRSNYNAPIKENLARAPNLEFGEVGLMRSPIHRAVIIDPSMTRVGFGIVKDAEGYFLITQNYSANPVTASNINHVLYLNQVNNSRSAHGLGPLTYDDNLAAIAREWSQNMTSRRFFAVTDPSSGESLVDFARERGIRSTIQIHIVQTSELSLLETELAKQEALLSPSNNKVGLGFAVNGLGDIFMTVFYTP